ncbi:flavin reductase family protein [Dubosiella newyorkensis]|uniref:flavin reductase family protein n=2 Tax=Dubosiella newyorkensis TaxID=1862672 RepID=UPI0025B768F9|nr:flavin reductase [Dubosiella newyorkensis]
MRKNYGGMSWYLPMPIVFVSTYDEEGRANVMVAAWSGIYDCEHVYLSLEMGHKTTHNLLLNRSFTLGFASKRLVGACEYVGRVSGYEDVDKFHKAGFTATPSTIVYAPLIEESPLCLECCLVSCENGIVIGKILNTSADERVLDEEGLPDLSKMDLLAFDPIHDEYIELGTAFYPAFR